MALMTDEEARRVAAKAAVTDELYGTPIPDGEWVGPGALDEFDDGRGADDDGEQAG